MSFDEALRLATSGIGDSKTLIALGLYGQRDGRDWQPDPAARPDPDAPARRAASRPG